MAPPRSTFPPGESPFRMKGMIWLGQRHYVEERVPGGTEAVRQRLDPGVREFFSGLFLASGWYDVLPIVSIANVVAAALKLDVNESIRRSAVWQAERDLSGAYSPVLQVDTPRAVCRRYSNIYSLIYDFGRSEVLDDRERRVRACAHGVPSPVARWWMRASECYLDVILRAAGARNPRLVWSPPLPDGERDGTALVRIPSITEWD